MSQLIPKFSLGRVVSTPGAMEALEDGCHDPFEFLARHVTGDWGDLDDSDRRDNDYAIGRPLRILSVYYTSKGVKIWVITEHDRSVTTFLLPEEY